MTVRELMRRDNLDGWVAVVSIVLGIEICVLFHELKTLGIRIQKLEVEISQEKVQR